MRVNIIVQARMGSTRLPGKVLMKVAGKTLLEYLLERLSRVTKAQQIIVATTTNPLDDSIAELCSRLGVASFRGSEEDVLSRYYEVSAVFKSDAVVRVTADCPLIDPAIIDKIIDYLFIDPELDYVSNTLERTYPRGMDTEVFTVNALKTAYREAKEHFLREHVTPYIYRNPDRFKLANHSYTENCSHMRLTVDTTEDFLLIGKVLENLYPHKPLFILEDCLSLLAANKDWLEINSSIVQKGVEE